jgi:hypothetical protein
MHSNVCVCVGMVVVEPEAIKAFIPAQGHVLPASCNLLQPSAAGPRRPTACQQRIGGSTEAAVCRRFCITAVSSSAWLVVCTLTRHRPFVGLSACLLAHFLQLCNRGPCKQLMFRKTCTADAWEHTVGAHGNAAHYSQRGLTDHIGMKAAAVPANGGAHAASKKGGIELGPPFSSFAPLAIPSSTCRKAEIDAREWRCERWKRAHVGQRTAERLSGA